MERIVDRIGVAGTSEARNSPPPATALSSGPSALLAAAGVDEFERAEAG